MVEKYLLNPHTKNIMKVFMVEEDQIRFVVYKPHLNRFSKFVQRAQHEHIEDYTELSKQEVIKRILKS